MLFEVLNRETRRGEIGLATEAVGRPATPRQRVELQPGRYAPHRHSRPRRRQLDRLCRRMGVPQVRRAHDDLCPEI